MLCPVRQRCHEFFAGSRPAWRDSFAIYGGGTSTLIAMPINVTTSVKSSTNILLFSTADGQTFTPTVISVSGLPSPSADNGPEHGVAFLNSSNLIFRPGTGSSTYQIQFPANFASLSSPVAATVVATNTTLPNGAGSDVYLFSYSPAGKLLADYGQILSAAGSTSLGLYDISSFSTANNLGSTNTPHYNANGNFTGGVALGGQGKTNAVYVLNFEQRCLGIFAFLCCRPGFAHHYRRADGRQRLYELWILYFQRDGGWHGAFDLSLAV